MPDFAAIPAQITINNDGSASVPTVGLNFRGEWDCTFAYSPGDAVIFNGAAYICINAITAPPNSDPLGWNIPVIGRIGSGERVNGIVRPTDPKTVGDPQPGSGVNNSAKSYTVNVTTVGTFTMAIFGTDNSGAGNPPGPMVDIYSQATGGNVLASFHAGSSSQSLTHLGIHNIIIRAYQNTNVNPFVASPSVPMQYGFSLTNGTGVLGPQVCNTTPDLDFQTWTNAGI